MILAIGAIALVASMLTLFTGFGLGTLLLPAFALFLPAETAVAATAVVHGFNSLFKALLVGGSADRGVLLRFGLPAMAAAFAGAALLERLALQPPITVAYPWGAAAVAPIKMMMGVLILVFAVVEFVPALAGAGVDRRWLPLGGAVSGFFGGLSGHQGALRAIFLRRAGLKPMTFAATQAILACMVDGSRLVVYGAGGWSRQAGLFASPATRTPIVVGTLCAFAGAFAGARLLPRVTLGALRYLTGALLLVVGAGLATGLF